MLNQLYDSGNLETYVPLACQCDTHFITKQHSLFVMTSTVSTPGNQNATCTTLYVEATLQHTGTSNDEVSI